MSNRLFIFALFCLTCVTTGYGYKMNSKVLDLPLESSTSKLYLSPSKIGWYGVNDDSREKVVNYNEKNNTYYYESKSYIIKEDNGIITIKDLHDMTEITYKITNGSLKFVSSRKI